MRVSSIALPLTLALTATALLAGCAGQSAPGAGAAAVPAAPPVQIPFSENISRDTGSTVGVHLEGEKPFRSKHYGRVLGYINGTTSGTSEVVTLSPSVDVTFMNVDVVTHTASFLGDATRRHAPWPATFTGSETASTAGTDIGTAKFSSGPLKPNSASLVYNSGAPGFYMFGCFFHYVSSGMRTVIIVK